MDWVDKPQNFKDLYGILQLLRGSHLNSFPLKTLKLGWVAFHSVKFQLKCLDFQSNQYKKLVPVLSRFCNWLCIALFKMADKISMIQRALPKVTSQQYISSQRYISNNVTLKKRQKPSAFYDRCQPSAGPR